MTNNIQLQQELVKVANQVLSLAESTVTEIVPIEVVAIDTGYTDY